MFEKFRSLALALPTNTYRVPTPQTLNRLALHWSSRPPKFEGRKAYAVSNKQNPAFNRFRQSHKRLKAPPVGGFRRLSAKPLSLKPSGLLSSVGRLGVDTELGSTPRTSSMDCNTLEPPFAYQADPYSLEGNGIMTLDDRNKGEQNKQALIDVNKGILINLETREDAKDQANGGNGVDVNIPILDRTPPICRSKGQHPKQHACLPAKFTINPNLDETLRIGVFRQSRTYAAWMRFSNSKDLDDTDKGLQGLAIKLKDVETEGAVQDFLFVNSPIFFTSTVKDYLSLLNFTGGNLSQRFNAILQNFNGILQGIKTIVFKLRKAYEHPLSQTYWSAAPFKHGEGFKVKFILRPRTPAPAEVATTRHGLSELIASYLSHDGVTFDFDFFLHVSDGTDDMPINDLTKPWPERGEGESKQNLFHAATLTLTGCPELADNLRQTKEFGEKLSFSPGNCLPEHEPLGELNIIRMHVYPEIAKGRRKENWGVDTADGFWPMPTENPSVCPFHNPD